MASDANRRAAARSAAGMTRELQVQRDDNTPHPSRGGSRGYPLWYRRFVLDQVNQHGMGLVDGLDVSETSVCRWINRDQPYRMTGGKPREQLIGKDLLLMSIFLYIYPDATADETCAFIFNNGGELYSRQAISKRMKDVGMSKKVTSTEAYQAFLPVNVRKAELFWSRSPPLGVVGVQRRRLLDMDEMAITSEQTNSKHGHSHTAIRIRKPGHYTRSKKITVVMAIEPGDPSLPPNVDGSIERPRYWIWIREEAGTNAVDFAHFCDRVCTEFEQNPAPGDVDSRRYFLWDNLTAHHAPIVVQTVEGRASNNHFEIVARPPYQPKFGPIEYAFGDLGAELQKRVQASWTTEDLKREIEAVAPALGTLGRSNNTFEHCGF